MAIKAITQANSTDPAKLIPVLESLKWEGLTGEEQVRAFDHQVEKNYFLLRGKAKDKMRDADDFADVITVGKSFVPQDQSECKRSEEHTSELQSLLGISYAVFCLKKKK